MTIAEAREKCKNLVARVPRDMLIIAILVLASSFSFGLGFLAGLDAKRENSTPLEPSPSAETIPIKRVIASKNGTKYYLPECAGAERITDENKVWFASASAAQAAGYAPAANCKGL
ncbi:hypothetical protein HY415_01615 [Candidatus Kaiserbacteria bacterium]|nr:hypothetical protein [Candidatus Kaiserbacteria bacterium]